MKAQANVIIREGGVDILGVGGQMGNKHNILIE
jgi:hypothetical protein